MAGFKSPNHTQTPNELFDELMAEMGEAELRVVLVAVRKTLGYHREMDEISITQFEKMSGLSRQGAIDGIAAAIQRGVLREAGVGKRGTKIYELVFCDDQSTELTSTSQTSRPVDASTSQASRHTKEREKEKGKKDTDPHPFKPADPLADMAGYQLIKAFVEAFPENARNPALYHETKAKKQASELARAGYTAAEVTTVVTAKLAEGRTDYIFGFLGADMQARRLEQQRTPSAASSPAPAEQTHASRLTPDELAAYQQSPEYRAAKEALL